MPLLASAVNGFWKKRKPSQGKILCFSALAQARKPIFYESWGIPDTLEGRFDCACLHLVLLLKHLKKPLSQQVFDTFFSYTEMTLREVGVSDLRVGKQVKKCAKFFYGAMESYENAIKGKGNLKDALTRNLFGGKSPQEFTPLIKYVKECDLILSDQDLEKADPIQWPSLR